MNGNADPVTYINNFYTIICSVITAIGAIVLLWAIVQLYNCAERSRFRSARQFCYRHWCILLICAPWIVKAIAGV
ncbi:MAG: hypothetical protein ACLR13_04505 [Acutalibacteraceae bacterium]